MIILRDISLTFPQKVLFDRIQWSIPDRSRIGLVGDNGSGKTTLLRTIVGQVDPDAGTVEIPERRNKIIGYLPQDLMELEPLPLITYLKTCTGLLTLEQSLRNLEAEIARTAPSQDAPPPLLKTYAASLSQYQLRDGYQFEARAQQVLRGLGFQPSDLERHCPEFSGGWKMRIMLAGLLLMKPDAMLLDEPTNHLDTESMEWLESWLRDYAGTVITVSHDRVFLDKITQQIAELDRGHLTLYRGNYSNYLRCKAERQEQQRKEIAAEKAEIDRTRAFIERFRFKATKAKQVQSRVKWLEKMDAPAAQEGKRTVRIRFPQTPRSGREVLLLQDVAKGYGPIRVLSKINLTILRGERVALIGVNGAGKSTLTRLLSGTEPPDAGTVTWGQNVTLGFYSQESAQNLCYERTVWEEIQAFPFTGNDQEKRNLLGAFLFSGEDTQKSISVLSGGEKSRLALLKLLLRNTNLLILDEPTNHLDAKTKEIFQNALLQYTGTLIIVSHDRFFLDQLVQRVIEVREGRIAVYTGNYSDFIAQRKAREGAAETAETPAANNQPALIRQKSREERRRIAEERNRLSRQRQTLQKHLLTLEKEILKAENRQREIESTLCQPECYRDPQATRSLTISLQDVKKELERLYGEWAAVSTELEAPWESP